MGCCHCHSHLPRLTIYLDPFVTDESNPWLTQAVKFSVGAVQSQITLPSKFCRIYAGRDTS